MLHVYTASNNLQCSTKNPNIDGHQFINALWPTSPFSVSCFTHSALAHRSSVTKAASPSLQLIHCTRKASLVLPKSPVGFNQWVVWCTQRYIAQNRFTAPSNPLCFTYWLLTCTLNIWESLIIFIISVVLPFPEHYIDGKIQDISSTPFSPHPIFPIFNILNYYGTLVTTDEPVWLHYF